MTEKLKNEASTQAKTAMFFKAPFALKAL